MLKRGLIILFVAVHSSLSFAQLILTIEGQSLTSNTTGYYGGYSVPRAVPTTFTYRNNIITTVNSSGYMLLAGDEVVSPVNNNLDGAVITGNRFIWNGTDPASATHALFTGYNKNVLIEYNYLNQTPEAILRKSNGMTNTSGGVAYNIVINPTVACVAKGMNNVYVYNNTFYSEKSRPGTWKGLVDVLTNTDGGLNTPSTGTRIFNNIFYTKHQTFNINIYDNECLSGFESDYNVFWCEDGEPMFQIGTAEYTFTQWKALGYDAHSVVINPNFTDFINFVPATRLDYGTDLGALWQAGLATDAVWGTISPATANQNGTWQAGARVFASNGIPVTGITVSGAGGATAITTDNGTLQMNAAVLPANASDKAVTWSVTNGTGQAAISTVGLLTASGNGTVTVHATAHDGSGVTGSLTITISNQVIPVTGITVSGAGGATTIASDNGTLQLSATILPANATDKTVTWTIINGSGQATVSSSGLVTAVANGTVTARAAANDGSGVSGTLLITISNQVIPITSITVTGAGGAAIITSDNGTLQLSAAVLPANASNKTVTWSLVNGTGQAGINSTGLVSAIADGSVTAIATANDGSGIYGSLLINISSQIITVTAINVTGAGGSTSISTDKGTLQMSAAVLPANASNKTITWSVINGTGQALVNSSGMLSALANGSVTVRATANDGSGIYGSLAITISNQNVPVFLINVSGAGGLTGISTIGGTLQLSAEILPANASDKSVTWSVESGTGQAEINATGLVTAVADGTVTAIATANDGSGVYGTLMLSISGQPVLVSGITVTGEGGSTSITSINGTLQLNAEVLPANATEKSVTWLVENGTGQAIINGSGLLTGLNPGTVTARATATDGSDVSGTLDITISNDSSEPPSITVTASEIRILLNDNYFSWTIGLYNLQGSLLEKTLVESDVVVFNSQAIPSGIYLIVLSKKDLLMVAKIIKF